MKRGKVIGIYTGCVFLCINDSFLFNKKYQFPIAVFCTSVAYSKVFNRVASSFSFHYADDVLTLVNFHHHSTHIHLTSTAMNMYMRTTNLLMKSTL